MKCGNAHTVHLPLLENGIHRYMKNECIKINYLNQMVMDKERQMNITLFKGDKQKGGCISVPFAIIRVMIGGV